MNKKGSKFVLQSKQQSGKNVHFQQKERFVQISEN